MSPIRRLFLVAALACLALPAAAGAVLDPQPAPPWFVSEWINGDPGKLEDHQGRVVVLHFFQLWCPGCNNFTIPLVERWNDLWGDRDDFMTVSIHTVFEGHDYQTPERLREFVLDNGILHPVGIDTYGKAGDEVPMTMRTFETLGTPHIAVVDKAGNLVFSHFGRFDVAVVEFLIERMLKEKTDVIPPPKPEGGKDLRRSGTYKLHFEQTSKSCGKLRAPWDTNMTLEVSLGQLVANFSMNIMGQSKIETEYDPRTLAISSTLSREAGRGATASTSRLELTGQFVRGSRPPKLEYQASFTRRGSRPDDNCDIEAQGSAVRIGD